MWGLLASDVAVWVRLALDVGEGASNKGRSAVGTGPSAGRWLVGEARVVGGELAGDGSFVVGRGKRGVELV